MKQPLTTVILAAGKGTRMKSAHPKVLHELFFAPMIHHVLRAIEPLEPTRNVIVVGHQEDKVRSSLTDFSVTFASQKEQLGTGHAVLSAKPAIPEDYEPGSTIMILCGDTPLLQPETLTAMYEQHTAKESTVTVMTTIVDNPTGYGRIVVDDSGNFSRIVEEKDATPTERNITEINGGIYCVDTTFLFESLGQITGDNAQGELYLTDIIEIAVKQHRPVERFICPDSDELIGVNSRVELARAHALLQQRRNIELMEAGVTMYTPETISIDSQATLANDITLHPGVSITGSSKIEPGCIIGAGCQIHSSHIRAHTNLAPYTVLHHGVKIS
jgi:bifunctional UDP-N-acetylglucosamine pyrophosphorylase/glucosamine-1-phosphate N-acetyltransferase